MELKAGTLEQIAQIKKENVIKNLMQYLVIWSGYGLRISPMCMKQYLMVEDYLILI